MKTWSTWHLGTRGTSTRKEEMTWKRTLGNSYALTQGTLSRGEGGAGPRREVWCVRACVRTCVRACVRACVLVCVGILQCYFGSTQKYHEKMCKKMLNGCTGVAINLKELQYTFIYFLFSFLSPLSLPSSLCFLP